MKRVKALFLIGAMLITIFAVTACNGGDKVIGGITHEFTVVTLADDADPNTVRNIGGMEAYFTENAMAEFYFDKKAFNEEEIHGFADLIYSDLLVLSDKTGRRMQKINVYVLGINTNMITHYYDAHVFITVNTMNDELMRSSLAGAAFGVSEPWIAYGIAAKAFDFSVNENLLWNFWTHVSAQDIFMRFGARYSPSFYNETDIKLSRDTAASLTAYVIEKHGWDALFENGGSFENEWLKANDIERTLSNPLETELTGFKYYSSNEYPGIIETDIGNYYVCNVAHNIVRSNHEGLIFMDRRSRAFLNDFISENVKRNINLFDLNRLSNVNIHRLDSPETREREAYFIGNNLFIRHDNYFYLNELIRYLYDARTYPEQFDWLTDLIVTYIALRDSGSYNASFMERGLNLNIPNSLFPGWMVEEYMARNTNYNTEHQRDAILICHVYAYLSIVRTRDHTANMMARPVVPGAVDVPGELSFVQQRSFIAFLIDTYSLDTIFDFYGMDIIDFDAIYGKSYVELREEWKNFLGITE